VVKADILRIIRQKVGQAVAEINGDDPLYLDDFIFEYLRSADFVLNSLGITTGLDIDADEETIQPEEVSIIIGMLLSLRTSADIVASDLIYKLQSGEMGLSFSTGAAQITTNQAAITLKTFADKLNKDFSILLTAYFAGDPDSIASRIQ